MGMPGPVGPGSCFRFSDAINLRAADAILSRAQRNNVVVRQLVSSVLKLNVGVEGARRIAVEAQMRAQRIGNATHSRIHISIHICMENRGATSLRPPGTELDSWAAVRCARQR